LAQLAALLLAAFYLPPLLIYFGFIPFAYRFVVLVAVAAILALVAWLRGTPARDLGLRSDNLKPALPVNAALAIAVGSGLLAAFWLGLMRQPRAIDWWRFAPSPSWSASSNPRSLRRPASCGPCACIRT
jgi:hypothetical protein